MQVDAPEQDLDVPPQQARVSDDDDMQADAPEQEGGSQEVCDPLVFTYKRGSSEGIPLPGVLLFIQSTCTLLQRAVDTANFGVFRDAKTCVNYLYNSWRDTMHLIGCQRMEIDVWIRICRAALEHGGLPLRSKSNPVRSTEDQSPVDHTRRKFRTLLLAFVLMSMAHSGYVNFPLLPDTPTFVVVDRDMFLRYVNCVLTTDWGSTGSSSTLVVGSPGWADLFVCRFIELNYFVEGLDMGPISDLVAGVIVRNLRMVFGQRPVRVARDAITNRFRLTL